MHDKTNKRNQDEEQDQLTGSKSDPQKTEMEGLKKGGVEPNVHPEDEARDEEGKPDRE